MTLPLLAPVLGIAPPNPDIDVDDALITAQIWTLAEIDLLAELDAFTPHPIVEDVRRRYETPATTRGELIDAYDVTDEDNVDHLDDLFDAGLALSDEVVRSMDPLPDPLIDRIDAGDTRFLDPNPWLDGLTDLLLRDGLPPDGPRELGDRQAIVRLLDELTGVPSELGNGPSDAPTPAPVVGPEPTTAPAPDPDPPPSAPETSAVPPTAGETTDGIADRPEGGQTTDAEATGGPADAPDGQTTDAEATGGPADAPDGQTTDVDADAGGSSPSLGLVATLAVGALVLAGVLVAALRSRRREDRAARSPSPSRQAPGRLDDLLDTSRRMTAALDSQEVQRIAVRDGIRLTRAEAGAFLAAGAEPRFAEAIPPRFFSEQPVTEGLLRRVLETGRATSATTDDEPSLVQLPMALAAVPVIAGGGVAGALVVLRSPSEPFSSDDVELLGQLGPIVGSALSAAEEHRSAVTDAERDGLTTLLNRRRLDQDLSKVTGAPVAFAMIDVDHFKRFNDVHGHQGGDDALRTVAAVLAETVRSTDVVYRYGGEEFSVLLRDTTTHEAHDVLERVREAIESTEIFAEDGRSLGQVTISVGVVATATDREPSSSLPDRADKALYDAKAGGRNRVVVGT